MEIDEQRPSKIEESRRNWARDTRFWSLSNK